MRKQGLRGIPLQTVGRKNETCKKNIVKTDIMNQEFRVFNTCRKTVPTKCIEGCCYGNDNFSNDILRCYN